MLLDYSGFNALPEDMRYREWNADRWNSSRIDLRKAKRSDPEVYLEVPRTKEKLRERLRQEWRRRA